MNLDAAPLHRRRRSRLRQARGPRPRRRARRRPRRRRRLHQEPRRLRVAGRGPHHRPLRRQDGARPVPQRRRLRPDPAHRRRGRRQADRRGQQGQGGADLRAWPTTASSATSTRWCRRSSSASRACDDGAAGALRRPPRVAPSCSGGERRLRRSAPGRGRMRGPGPPLFSWSGRRGRLRAVRSPGSPGRLNPRPRAPRRARAEVRARPVSGGGSVTSGLRPPRRSSRARRSARRSPASTQPAEASGIASSTPTIPPSVAPDQRGDEDDQRAQRHRLAVHEVLQHVVLELLVERRRTRPARRRRRHRRRRSRRCRRPPRRSSRRPAG